MLVNLHRLPLAVTVTLLALPFAAGAALAAPLAAANGMTLYTYDKDQGGTSACYDACAGNWPPYMVKMAKHSGKDWSEVKRKDGTMQWAYKGKPLYFFAMDKKTGDAMGDGKNGVWHMASE